MDSAVVCTMISLLGTLGGSLSGIKKLRERRICYED